MLLLTKGTGHKLRLTTDAAGDIEVSYSVVDKTGTGPASYSYAARGEPLPSIVTAMTTDIVAGIANTETSLRQFSAFNNHATQAVNCKVFEEYGADTVTHAKVLLLPGEKLDFDSNGDWAHYDATMASYVYVSRDGAQALPALLRAATWVRAEAQPIETPVNAVYRYVQHAGRVVGVAIAAGDGEGACVIDIRKSPTASFPPAEGDSIVGATPPQIVAGRTYVDHVLGDWNVALAEGDWLAFVLKSCAGFSFVSVEIEIEGTPS